MLEWARYSKSSGTVEHEEAELAKALLNMKDAKAEAEKAQQEI